jgi:hypothetical protein
MVFSLVLFKVKARWLVAGMVSRAAAGGIAIADYINARIRGITELFVFWLCPNN